MVKLFFMSVRVNKVCRPEVFQMKLLFYLWVKKFPLRWFSSVQPWSWAHRSSPAWKQWGWLVSNLWVSFASQCLLSFGTGQTFLPSLSFSSESSEAQSRLTFNFRMEGGTSLFQSACRCKTTFLFSFSIAFHCQSRGYFVHSLKLRISEPRAVTPSLCYRENTAAPVVPVLHLLGASSCGNPPQPAWLDSWQVLPSKVVVPAASKQRG